MAQQRTITRLATDIGGTFTDIVLERGEARFTTKVLTTPHAPEEAVVEGTRLVLKQAGSASPTSTSSSTARRWRPMR